MEGIPADIIPLFVETPDDLAAMLRVCKWINAALTIGGGFVLYKSGGKFEVKNSLISFTISIHGAITTAKREYAKWHSISEVSRNNPCKCMLPRVVYCSQSILYHFTCLGWRNVKIHTHILTGRGVGIGHWDNRVSRERRGDYIVVSVRDIVITGEWFYCDYDEDPRDVVEKGKIFGIYTFQ